MRNKLFFVFLILSIYCCCTTEKKQESNINPQIDLIEIYLREFEIYFVPDSCEYKTSIDLGVGKGRLEIDLKNCNGALQFKYFNANNNLAATGAYSRSLDTLKKYSTSKSAIDGTNKVHLISYFQPLPDGVWRYYNGDSVINKIEYSLGIKKE